ncbi:hypothetical protein K431DRAFT_219229 [Polychaeton citri CBS 116435]|uniref:Gem-associated protein 5 TPR domain-containing protein n=1 Tax=Polychaeton citri CBS 116435 TaxID=1314669 RepID=A0A9P4URB9_9PEZI|nr:hypothetical protein K431DRAFT_219229 [Polychaeton citri CBS 116435]
MSSGHHLDRSRSRSTASKHSSSLSHSRPGIARHTPPPAALTPENKDVGLEPCAATGSFFLYAQRNIILCLHHDTLAIERRFELHHEDVEWISVDNVSERGAGRLAVSYDKGHTAIVWDIFTGQEVARFAAYDQIRVASFMRNGNIAFGNNKGAIILFEPSTSEHINARTIFDPITSLAPSSDCRTFAIGYMNGSILVATLQPAFTILHTLTTSRAPSQITGLAWHGSSSKQKTDMLATQTSDGDMRVWSVPKHPHQDTPNIIRVLTRTDSSAPGLCWFAWSKNGRIVQHAEGETRAWDVRTKKVTYDAIPTMSDMVGIANYGPTATLFTIGRNHTVQQYDVNPSGVPMQVASVQHVPANTPPTPPTILEERANPYADHDDFSNTGPDLANFTDGESSADEGGMSPLQKIAQEMDSLDQLESELRDKVMPLSPTSSRASSRSSRSSHGRRRQPKYLYDRPGPGSSRASTSTGADGTEFSFGGPSFRNHDSMSTRSGSTRASNTKFTGSHLRKEVSAQRETRPQDEAAGIDLFPFLKHHIKDVAFRTPHYGSAARTPELLQREMLSTVFGWNGEVAELIRDEMAKHSPGSATNVLLAKWLADDTASSLTSMVGSQSMTSSDWMLLALSSIGSGSQKQVGEAFVQRLLEKGDVHPAVAILLTLKEHNDAIEVYISQQYYLEAVLLISLLFPHDWQRQSHLLRKWGESAVRSGQPELAVRLFSCCSIETTEPWRSPRTQDAVYAAQQERLMGPGSLNSPPLSPPSRSGSGRLAAKNPSLKLITSFGDRGVPINTKQPLPGGVTPIAESALSPVGAKPWLRASSRGLREPSSARTATPGGYARRKRLPSRSDIERAKQEAAEMATPLTAHRDIGSKPPSIASRSRRGSSLSRASSSIAEPTTALRETGYDLDRLVPSTADVERMPVLHDSIYRESESDVFNRGTTQSRRPEGLEIQVMDTRFSSAEFTPAGTAKDLESLFSPLIAQKAIEIEAPKDSPGTLKAKAIDEYIDSVEAAQNVERRERGESRRRGESKSGRRGESRRREPSMSRTKEARYINPPKKSPSSPVPMSPEELAQAHRKNGSMDAEEFYKLASPIEPAQTNHFAFEASLRERREQSRDARGRGRSSSHVPEASMREPSPEAPLQLTADRYEPDEVEIVPEHVKPRTRQRSSSRRPEDLQSHRGASRVRTRERSTSRRPSAREDEIGEYRESLPGESTDRRPRQLSRKELAAKELEERRLSLARRPSAPSIPLPGHHFANRPNMLPRSHTELGDSPTSFNPPFSRSHTVDPEAMMRHGGKTTGTSTMSTPIGLPATPRAMRHPRYMSSEPEKDDGAPPVPSIPGNFSELSSTLSYNSSQLSSSTGHTGTSEHSRAESQSNDDIAPLLPSTVFGQKGPQAPPRSASAPPEKLGGGLPLHPAYKAGISSSARNQGFGKHMRKISPPDATQGRHSPPQSGLGEASRVSYDHQVIVIPEDSDEQAPAALPELQHLVMPPPPPPPPTMYSQLAHGSGTINILMGDDDIVDANMPASLPQPMERIDRAATVSPSYHRHGRGSVSESIGSRWRGFGDRMRSSSRNANRAKSPPLDHKGPAPYETVLPSIPQSLGSDAIERAKSPYELAMAQNQGLPHSQQIPPPPPPPPPAAPLPGTETRISETSIPPMRSRSVSGYRNPKEIRANMPPETLQQGVYQPQGGFL